MSKKFLILFTLVISVFIIVFFYPQKIFGANDHVVISQIQISGVTATDEFIELFNPTSNPIDLTGFRLSKKISSGTLSNLQTTMNGTIPAHGYFLVKHPTGYTGSTIADSQYSTASSITPDNTVILYSDAGTTIIDKVGFGSAFEFETSPFPTSPASGSSIKRYENNDTDNNSLDFLNLETSNPRNTNAIEKVIQTPSPMPAETPILTPSSIPTIEPTQMPTETPIFTSTPTTTNVPTETETPTSKPTPSSTSSATVDPSPTSVPSPTQTNKHHKNRDFNFPFGIKCSIEKREFKFKKMHFKYYKLHLKRD